MRILIVSTHDSRGGAGKSAYRFAKEFIKQGKEVCLYVKSQSEKDEFIKQSKTSSIVSKLLHVLDFAPGYILSGFDKDCGFTLGLFGEGLGKIVKEFKPDIINIHWTWKGFVSFQEICRISKKIPVVWTMHDQSPFSGGLFYPDLKNKKLLDLLAKINNSLRKQYIRNANMTFVSPSRFLLSEFKQTNLKKLFEGIVINNGVDREIFCNRRESKREIKEKLHLKNGKRYILFGGMNLANNEVKGGIVLQKVFGDLEKFLIDENIGVVSYGSQNVFESLNLNEKIETQFMGYIDTDESMVTLLSAADLVLVPSLFENYPYAILEPLSCGIPVVAFRVGGIPELIKNENMGYLANPEDTDDFEMGIKKILSKDINDYQKDFLYIETQGKKYLELFNNDIKASRS